MFEERKGNVWTGSLLIIPGNYITVAMKIWPSAISHITISKVWDSAGHDEGTCKQCIAEPWTCLFLGGFIKCSDASLTRADHCSAHPVATCTNTAVTLYLGLCSVFIRLVLQGAFCRVTIQTSLYQHTCMGILHTGMSIHPSVVCVCVCVCFECGVTLGFSALQCIFAFSAHLWTLTYIC